MDLTFRLPGPWGAGKGANLQPTEVDANFWELAQAIVDLQSNPAQPVGIESISVSGTQMTITLTDGTVMGPFTLPVLTFRWRGEWVPLAAYAELDVFTVEFTGIFMAVLAHTSGATFDPNIAVSGEPALLQLFGSTDASLSGLSDVEITAGPNDGEVLIWSDADAAWVNTHLGTMGLQDADAVSIAGGTITGMPPPGSPSDVATKAYVDALPLGMSIDDGRMMANVSGMVGPALPNSLTDFLDHVLATTARGTLLFRGGAGWIALPPGAAGQFLQTAGSGADPAWAVGGSGVTSVTAGTGISTGASPITATGTVSLAAIADDNILANTSGASAAPVPTTLTAFLDSVLGTARGSILTRTVGGWVSLAPGLIGQYLKTLGSGADLVWDSPVGAGTVTSIASGAGLTGGPITGSGTLSLATIANNSLLANISGGVAAPGAATPSLLFDTVFGATQGSILYRNASAWVVLTPGTSGHLLTSGGAAANPAWAAAPAGASVADLRLVSNISGGTAAPVGNTLSGVFDAILGSSRGMIVYRGSAGWAALSPGTAGQVLTTGGAAGDPSWAAGGGGGVALHPGYRSGAWYTRPISASGANTAMTANRIYVTPILIGAAITIDGVQMFVGTPATTTSADIGIYANASGAPGTLIRDFGTINTALSSTQSVTGFTQALAAGWYWLAAWFSGTPSIISSAATDVSQQHFLGSIGLASSYQGNQGWTTNVTFSAGNLPTTLSGPTLGASSYPLIAFRVQ
jgi:hypothetical protein